MKAKGLLSTVLSVFLAVLTLFSFAGCGENKFIQLSNWNIMASLPNLITVEYQDEDVICKYSAEKNKLLSFDSDRKIGNEIEVQVNQMVAWSPQNEDGESLDGDYITVLLYKKSKVIGYAVIKVTIDDKGYVAYEAKVLEEKIFIFSKTEKSAKKIVTEIIRKQGG